MSGWLREASILFYGQKISGCQHQGLIWAELCLSINSMPLFLVCLFKTNKHGKKAVLLRNHLLNTNGALDIITSEQISKDKKGQWKREEEGEHRSWDARVDGGRPGRRHAHRERSTEEPQLSGNQNIEISSSTQILEIATRGSPLRIPLNKQDQSSSMGQWVRQLTMGHTVKSVLCRFRFGYQMRHLLNFSRPLCSHL